MNARTDYSFTINNQTCIVRNVPCYEHDGYISFNMEVVGILSTIREKMISKEIPYDVRYEDTL